MTSPRDAPQTIDDDLMMLRTLMQQDTLAVAIMDGEGRLKSISPALRKLIGPTPRGIPASHFPEFFDLYDASGTRRLRPDEVPLTRAAAGETVRDVVLSLRRPDAPVRYLRCDAAPLKGPAGESLGAVVLVVDVTAEHRAVARQEVVRRPLLDTVNHELRTPLAVVLASAELLVDAAPGLPEDLRRPLEAIVQASGQLAETVQHVADLVDLEGATHPIPAESNIAALLREARARCRFDADQRNVEVQIDCPPSLTWRLDHGWVRKAVVALLDNAIVHGPRDNTVVVSAAQDEDVLRLAVVDQGCGIPDDDRERLTHPFERGGAVLEDQHRSGLGLPLAHVVATSHHGALAFSQREPRGFTARMVLP